MAMGMSPGSVVTGRTATSSKLFLQDWPGCDIGRVRAGQYLSLL
jgi:hypothetical protein